MLSSQDDEKIKFSGRVSTITAITNPLKFFALALLIVEAIIAILAIQEISTELMTTLAYLATFMFVLVVMMVVLIVFKAPDVLTATKPAELLKALRESRSKVEIMLETERIKEEWVKSIADEMDEIKEIPISTKPVMVKQKRPNEND